MFAVLAFSVILTGCGGSNSNSAVAESELDLDEAVVERFGQSATRNMNPQSDAVINNQVIGSFNDLSLRLLREQVDVQTDSNLVNSGYSLAIAMSMLQRATAGNDFALIQEILGVSAVDENDLYTAINAIDLDLESRTNAGLELRSANSLFIKPDYPLETQFLDVMTTQFNAPISEAQFTQDPEAVRDEINQWASENTNGLIPELLSRPLPTNTVLALLNATLLDARWLQEFEDVSEHEFTSIDASVRSVPGFTGTGNFHYADSEQAMAVSLQYEGSQVSLMIVIPEDLETYTANLTTSAITQLRNESTLSYLKLSVPNWSTESSIDFSKLPMTSNLTDRMLNMTRLSPSPDCCGLSAFKQEAVIEVDKNGTRAAAITYAGASSTSAAVRVPEIVDIDQPFLFFIRDEPTGLILFSGRVLSL